MAQRTYPRSKQKILRRTGYSCQCVSCSPYFKLEHLFCDELVGKEHELHLLEQPFFRTVRMFRLIDLYII